MNTEHIMQIAISLDDDAIKERALAHCAKEITKCLEDGYIASRGYGRTPGERLIEDINKTISVFLENHKDEIIENVSNDISNRLFRSKKFRDSIVDEINE